MTQTQREAEEREAELAHLVVLATALNKTTADLIREGRLDQARRLKAIRQQHWRERVRVHLSAA